MTFLQLINEIKNKYKTNNQVVFFTIIFELSKKVKNKVDFTKFRNNKIDFNLTKFYKLLDDYFCKGKPLGQIVGRTTFCGVKIDVYKNIFEPRSETELITEQIIKILKHHSHFRSGIDLCCGTGCMGIAINKHCPNTHMTFVDINPKAIANTKHNAKLNKINIKTIVGDFYESLIKNKLKFDFIVCNPPYISKKELDTNMTRYETEISFNNSSSVNYFYNKLIQNKKKILNSYGKIFFETKECKLRTINR